MWDRAYGNNLYVLFFLPFWKKWLKNYWHFVTGGTAIVILIALYFVIKWAVKNGIKEAYSAITGKKTVEDIQNEKELKELGLDSEDQ